MISFIYIGFFKCSTDYKDEQPRQGVFSKTSGFIELVKGNNYEQGLKDLEGFSHLWVIFVFHHNSTWKPLTNPPYSDGNGKKGVFATRSPYRPNPIGMSAVRIDKIEGNKIFVTDSDLLNNTPILDIKPYISDYDSFPHASRGWLDGVEKENYEIEYSQFAKEKIDFLLQHDKDLSAVISSRLAFNPFDKTRNKFENFENGFVLKFQSWRIFFTTQEKIICITNLESIYTNYEVLLGNDAEKDLNLHKLFNEKFTV